MVILKCKKNKRIDLPEDQLFQEDNILSSLVSPKLKNSRNEITCNVIFAI